MPQEPCFDERRCLEVVQGALDTSHCVEILQALQWLELHSALTTQFVDLLCRTIVPQLHELRAREVLVVARALGAYQLLREEKDEASLALAPSALERCFENLRRHEPFLESSWHTLLPFKLLCMEVDAGISGSQRLSEVLNPMMFGFVDRLRSLSYAECEANRVRREEEKEDGSSAGNGKSATVVDDRGNCDANNMPMVQEFAHHRLVVRGYAQDLPVDVLIEPLL